MKLPELNWPAAAYFWIGCVWLGSIAHSAYRILCGDNVTAAGIVLRIIVASFAGLLGVLLGVRCNWSMETIGAICGIAGWAGGRFVRVIERRVMKEISGE